MIRPASHQQMQRVGQPQLQSPRKPRTNAHLLSASPLKQSTYPKSPIKKHLLNAGAFAPTTPSVGATVASDDELDRVSTSPLHGPLKAKLRASVLQAVLRLLDQDVNALAGAHEVLQAAAALPLAEPRVQRACVQALRELQDSSTSSMPPSFIYDSGSAFNSNWDAHKTPVPPPSPRKQTKAVQQSRSSGCTKSATKGSLHHCKEFLLACANEIHELEDEHPMMFDYAEDTSSSLNFAQPSESLTDKMCKHCGAENFDYASTVQGSSDASAESDDSSDDDTRADQGSQFSEVLHRAEFMSEVEDNSDDGEVELVGSTMLIRDRVVCRHVLRALHEFVQSQRQSHLRRSSAPNLAVKFRVFEALKLQANITRKRLAFQSLKNGLHSRLQQRPTVPEGKLAEPHSSSLPSMTFRTLMLHHSDVLLLLLALAFLANLPAQYIM
ncbi:hypothetical protein KRP22_007321 [Phytophthora ramorum]|nr:hypothetical protein KRP22_4668 [Phytophthora ramorum]